MVRVNDICNVHTLSVLQQSPIFHKPRWLPHLQCSRFRQSPPLGERSWTYVLSVFGKNYYREPEVLRQDNPLPPLIG